MLLAHLLSIKLIFCLSYMNHKLSYTSQGFNTENVFLTLLGPSRLPDTCWFSKCGVDDKFYWVNSPSVLTE